MQTTPKIIINRNSESGFPETQQKKKVIFLTFSFAKAVEDGNRSIIK